MNITINTISGTFVVPAERQSDLIMWLERNAIKIGGQEPVREQTQSRTQQNPAGYPGRQLINESI